MRSLARPAGEPERINANLNGRLVHEGQTIEAGETAGSAPATDTLGFRWSAINNLFLTAGDVAADEWRASRNPDEDNAERELRQFVWCLPTVPLKWEQVSLELSELMNRMAGVTRGIVPAGTKYLTAGVDIGKYLVHWILVAWSEKAFGQIVEYGRIEVPSDDLGVEQAVMVALKQFREQVNAGWPIEGAGDKAMQPHQVWVDSGYMTPIVYEFVRQSGKVFMPCIGRGANQQRQQWYNRPTSTGNLVKAIGQDFHITLLPAERMYLIEVHSDYWKTWVHSRLSCPRDVPGAMTLFKAAAEEHMALAKHLTAEKKVEEFVTGRGVVTRWERIRRQNHWFDAIYNASAAGHYCGVRLPEEAEPYKPPPRRSLSEMHEGARRSDGRPFIDTERFRENWDRIMGR